jgi:hypothetical protein
MTQSGAAAGPGTGKVSRRLRAAWTMLMPTASAAAARMARVRFVESPQLSNGLRQPQVSSSSITRR